LLSSSYDISGNSRAVSPFFSGRDSRDSAMRARSSGLTSQGPSFKPSLEPFASPRTQLRSNFAGTEPGFQNVYAPTTTPPPTRVTQYSSSSVTTQTTAQEQGSDPQSWNRDPLQAPPYSSPTSSYGTGRETPTAFDQSDATDGYSLVRYDSYEQAPEVPERSDSAIGSPVDRRHDFNESTWASPLFDHTPPAPAETLLALYTARLSPQRGRISRYTRTLSKPLTAVSRFVTGEWARGRGGSHSGSEAETELRTGRDTDLASRIAHTWRR